MKILKLPFTFAALCLLFLVFGCDKSSNATEQTPEIKTKQTPKMATQPSEIITKPFHNLEMVEYCLPIPTNYNENQDFAATAPKAQHQFTSVNSNPLKITFKGTILNSTFAKLQATIESQLENMKVDNDSIVKGKKFISYSYVKDGTLYFEKKWLVDNKFTVTATVSQDQEKDTTWFQQVKALYETAQPDCNKKEVTESKDEFDKGLAKHLTSI